MELKDIKDSSIKVENENKNETNKKVGFWFGLGIFIAPYIFGWFTLKNGYSKTARVVSFCWLFIVVIANLNKPENVNRSTASDSSYSKEKNEDFTLTGLNTKLSKYDSPMIVGEIQNNTNKHFSYIQVSFNLYDKSGAQIGSTMTNLSNFEPYGKWKFEALVNEDKVHNYKLQAITAY